MDSKKNLVEENLKITDAHYEKPVEHYLEKINNPKIHSANCVWEIFYIGKRAANEKEIVGVLRRRKKWAENLRGKPAEVENLVSENPKIVELCERAINWLNSK